MDGFVSVSFSNFRELLLVTFSHLKKAFPRDCWNSHYTLWWLLFFINWASLWGCFQKDLAKERPALNVGDTIAWVGVPHWIKRQKGESTWGPHASLILLPDCRCSIASLFRSHWRPESSDTMASPAWSLNKAFLTSLPKCHSLVSCHSTKNSEYRQTEYVGRGHFSSHFLIFLESWSQLEKSLVRKKRPKIAVGHNASSLTSLINFFHTYFLVITYRMI